jgi:hypothetical protein
VNSASPELAESTADGLLQPLLFGHELELLGNLRRFPLIVRYKLDCAEVAISLAQWQALSYSERRELALLPAMTDAERKAYKMRLDELAFEHFRQPFDVAEQDPVPSQYAPGALLPAYVIEALENEGLRPPSAAQWHALSGLARFGLLKLSRAGHRNRRLAALVSDVLGSDPSQANIPSDRDSERST